MANLLEDIQCTGSDTRPPMLDRTDFASWQQQIRLETLTKRTEGALHLGPERPRVYSDLTSEEKDRGHGNNTLGAGVAGYGRAQNRVGYANLGQARQIKCYNYNDYVHENPSSAYPVYNEAGLSYDSNILSEVVQIIMWCLDSCCSKHMIGDHSWLRNFMNKFIGTVRFGNDHFGAIMGYGDYVIGDNVISRVYYAEGLGHNLFSIRQFCDSDLEVAFMKHSFEDIMKSSPMCLLSKASKTKSWLWYRRLNYLNFSAINELVRKDIVRGLPRLKFEKDHLCFACQLGKSKKHTHSPKTKSTNLEVLNTLHMNLYRPMKVQTINGKKYILVIIDDYTRFTWVKFLRSKDETLENGDVERRNRTLVEAARTMLIFSNVQMFLWAEVVTTACYTQNRSIIHTHHNKILYELVHNKKPDLTFLCIFGALCYPTNDSKDLGKLQPTADIGIFIGYAPSRKGYRFYNKRT
nr:hypothetical protein [Tanacetum cinerariifolium]